MFKSQKAYIKKLYLGPIYLVNQVSTQCILIYLRVLLLYFQVP